MNVRDLILADFTVAYVDDNNKEQSMTLCELLEIELHNYFKSAYEVMQFINDIIADEYVEIDNNYERAIKFRLTHIATRQELVA